MSIPELPDIDPNIKQDACKSIDLLLSSIALEEISLSHLLNAEAEKLQCFLKTDPKCLNSFIKINNSVNQMLRTIVKSQILLHFKLEDLISMDKNRNCTEEKREYKQEDCHCHQEERKYEAPEEIPSADLTQFSCDDLI